MLMSDTLVYAPATVNASVQPNEIQSWTDLLNPKWRNKIVMQDPRGSGTGFSSALFWYYSPSLGPEFTGQFFRQGVIFSPDERQNLEWTDSGRTLVNISARPREIQALQEVGGKVRPLDPLKGTDGKTISAFSGSDGILFIPNIDPLPHPNAAKVYANWFYSREGQQAMVDLIGSPSNRADVDNSKLPAYSVPKAGVEYMNLNHYTDTRMVQEMREHVNQVYVPPQ
jgi:hypothetical protein